MRAGAGAALSAGRPGERTVRKRGETVEKEVFIKKVYSAMQKELGEGYRLELKEVVKNNGVVLHGLLIHSEGKNVVPTIYLDSFWEAYKSGQCFAAVIRQLLESPHIDFLDLALCFYYAYDGQIGEGAIRIKNSHAQRWGVKTADLVRLAEQNTARIFGWQCISMEDMIRESPDFDDTDERLLEEAEKDGFLEYNPMKIRTNAKRVYGAVCMLYPGVLEKLSAKVQKSFYILPSSVHEVILLPETGIETAGELRAMISDVNSTLVAPEEVLSDNLYYYDFKEKRVKIIY